MTSGPFRRNIKIVPLDKKLLVVTALGTVYENWREAREGSAEPSQK